MNDPIVRLLTRPGILPSDVPTLLRKLAWPPSRRAELEAALDVEEQEGRLVRIKGDRYVRPEDAGLVTGRLRVNRGGRGWLAADDPNAGEVAVAEADTGTAFNDDRVLVRKDPSGPTGVVVRVLERRRTRFVGTLHRGKGVLRVVPDDPRIPHEFYVPEPKGAARRAQPGDKVVVELKEWESRRANPEGEVVEVLGAPDAEGVDMLSVLRQYNLEKEFPRVVVDAAKVHGDRIRDRDLTGREDCRGHRVVTIDPDDAKDFDDAICVEREAGGSWRVWVHVADVAHYVKPGSVLDQEALERGNSTYLVDRVIPMLPEGLSNELCSLKPGVDRLTQCVEFHLAPEGRVRQARFYRAVIHSKSRYTYAEALAVLKRPARDAFDDMLHDASLLAQRLRRARFEAGALELGSSEIKIRLDAQGRVHRLEKHENDESHQLIEEYMLLANEAVAKRLHEMNRLALHRVHEEPEPRRLAEYREQVRALGIECGDLRQRAEMRRLTDRIAKHPAGHALRVGLLRSLQRARYDVEPGGHFGLAKKHYAHFTSPIRRYSDLVVHRALSEGPVGDLAELTRLGRHLSDTERNSGDAERDSREAKLFHYLDGQMRHGRRHPYTAVITGVQPNGFLVDAPDLSIGGLVPVSSLDDDFYVLDVARRCWVGRRRRRVYRVGDTVTVRVRKVDLVARRLDFELVVERTGGAVIARAPLAPAARPTGGRRRPAAAPARPATPPARPSRPLAGSPARPARPAPSARPQKPLRPLKPSVILERPTPSRRTAPVMPSRPTLQTSARPMPPRRPAPTPNPVASRTPSKPSARPPAPSAAKTPALAPRLGFNESRFPTTAQARPVLRTSTKPSTPPTPSAEVRRNAAESARRFPDSVQPLPADRSAARTPRPTGEPSRPPSRLPARSPRPHASTDRPPAHASRPSAPVPQRSQQRPAPAERSPSRPPSRVGGNQPAGPKRRPEPKRSSSGRDGRGERS